jgi:hypothetical protein
MARCPEHALVQGFNTYVSDDIKKKIGVFCLPTFFSKKKKNCVPTFCHE